jgi:hypothetical protein
VGAIPCFLIYADGGGVLTDAVMAEFMEWWEGRPFDMKRQCLRSAQVEHDMVLWLELQNSKHLNRIRAILKRRHIRYTELAELPEGVEIE